MHSMRQEAEFGACQQPPPLHALWPPALRRLHAAAPASTSRYRELSGRPVNLRRMKKAPRPRRMRPTTGRLRLIPACACQGSEHPHQYQHALFHQTVVLLWRSRFDLCRSHILHRTDDTLVVYAPELAWIRRAKTGLATRYELLGVK